MSKVMRRATALRIFAVALIAVSGPALAGPPGEGPSVAGIPVDFILFALTLLGVALFHRHTLQVALTGLAVITALQTPAARAASWATQRRR